MHRGCGKNLGIDSRAGSAWLHPANPNARDAGAAEGGGGARWPTNRSGFRVFTATRIGRRKPCAHQRTIEEACSRFGLHHCTRQSARQQAA
jgi:hypothetical protein